MTFEQNLERWLVGKDQYIVDYILKMKESGKNSLTDFEVEHKLVTTEMKQVERFGVRFMYLWSIRNYIEEVLLYC